MSKKSSLPGLKPLSGVPSALCAPSIACSETSTVTILSLSANCNDHAELQDSLAGISCRTITANGLQDGLQLLQKGGISIVVCDSSLGDDAWREILNRIPPRSSSPALIVSSSCADEHLWTEVLNLGGFDVIAKPFQTEELRYVIQTAAGTLSHASRRVEAFEKTRRAQPGLRVPAASASVFE
jgi:DNA-binding response OmpR family regulator